MPRSSQLTVTSKTCRKPAMNGARKGPSAAIAFGAYCVWAIRYASDGAPWRVLTIAPFGVCIVRYGVLLRRGAGEAPEELLLKDRWLQLLSVAWIVVFLLSVHAAG